MSDDLKKLQQAASGIKPKRVTAQPFVPGESIWIVTPYKPDPTEWDETSRRR